MPPRSLTQVMDLVVGGAGGELAHGFYYPGSGVLSEQWAQLGTDERIAGLLAHLTGRLVRRHGPTAAARGVVRRRITAVLRTAADAGLDGAEMLDYFYADERLRRWGLTGERLGIVSPLLSPAFVLAAFAMTPAQRTANDLHLELLRRLQPAWADIPFFAGGGAQRRIRRVADAADAGAIAGLVDRPESWQQLLAPEAVHRMWQASVAGSSSDAQERILAKLVWQAGSAEHLAQVDRHLAQTAAVRPASGIGRARSWLGRGRPGERDAEPPTG